MDCKDRDNKNEENQLNLYTNGHCFFCLKLIDPQVAIKKESKSLNDQTKRICSIPSSKSLQQICQFLEIDFEKILKTSVKTPGIVDTTDQLSARNEIQASFCINCGNSTTNLTNLLQKLKEIKDEINNCLLSIHTGISETERDSELVESYQNSVSKDMRSLIMAGFINELRKDISLQCLAKKFKVEVKACPSKCHSDAATQAVVDAKEEIQEPEENSYEEILFGDEMDPIITQINSVPSSSCKKFASPSISPETFSPPSIPSSSQPVVKTPLSFQLKYNPLPVRQSSFLSQPSASTPSARKARDIARSKFKRQVTWKAEENERLVKTEENKPDNPTYDDDFISKAINSLLNFEETPQKRPQNENLLIVKKEGMYQCGHSPCRKLFNSQGSAYSHCRSDHVKKTSKPRRTLSTPLTMDSQSDTQQNYCVFDNTTGKYKCSFPLCNREFASVQNVVNHYNPAHLNVRYTCEICNKEFQYVRTLKAHQKVCEL